MRMYLDDLNNPEELYEHVSDVRNVQWFDDKGEPVDDKTSELADRYTEYAMMCRTGEEQPIPYSEWLLVQNSLRQADTVKIDPESVTRLVDEEQSINRHNEYLKICQSQNVDPLDYWDWLDFDKKYQEHVRTAASPLSPATYQQSQDQKPASASASIDPEFLKDMDAEQSLITRYNEYVDICEAGGNVPKNYEEWSLVGKKSQESTVELRSELDQMTSDRDALRKANSALALRCQELVDSYENQKAELWKKIEDLRDRVQELTSGTELEQVTKERDDLAKDLALAVNHKSAAERFTQNLRDEIGSLKREALFNKQSYTDEDYENLLAIRDELVLENEALIKELSANGQRKTPANQPLYPHYFRETPNTTHVDISWFLHAWDVNSVCGHAVKKLMCAGQRGVKDKLQDLKEARNSINRAIELEETI